MKIVTRDVHQENTPALNAEQLNLLALYAALDIEEKNTILKFLKTRAEKNQVARVPHLQIVKSAVLPKIADRKK